MSRRGARPGGPARPPDDKPPVSFDYRMRFEDGDEAVFRIRLDAETLALIRDGSGPMPDWARLDFCRCPNCTLDADAHPHCPVAVSVAPLVERFRDAVSYRPVEVTVETPQRRFFQQTTLQNALSSITGIYMTTAGCPVLDRMRPMVETHLPFASQEETTYRTVSMYLFAQFALARRGQRADWTLGRLMAFLRDVGQVNTAFCERLNSIPHRGDASVNALAILDSLACLTGITIESGRLDHWEALLLRHWAP